MIKCTPDQMICIQHVSEYILYFALIADAPHDFVIEGLTPNSSSTSVCEEIRAALGKYEKRPIACRPGTVGSIVRIRLTGTKRRPLALCDVEVYGGNPMQHYNRCLCCALAWVCARARVSACVCVSANVRICSRVSISVCTSSVSLRLSCDGVRLI